MTELEIMKNAEACLRLLVKGIDPFTKEPVPENDIVRKKEIARYLNFTADFLHQNISDMQEISPENLSARFFVSPERAADFKADNEPVTISKISQTINAGFSPEQDGFIPTKALSEWLESKKLLEKRSTENGSYRRIATKKALDYGITNSYNSKGNFKSVIFDTQAQQWIYDCIDEISEFCIQNAEQYPRPEKITAQPMESVSVPEILLFQLTSEQKASLRPFSDEKSISAMTEYLNSFIDTSQVKPLKNGILSSWLFSNRILERKRNQKEYTPTQDGKKIGIICKSYIRNGYEFNISLFTPQAQQYIFDHIDDLIEFNQLEN